MTNFERYKNEILNFSTQGTEEIPAIVNGKPALCDNTKCEDCELGGSCARDFIKWLYEDDGEERDGCMGCKHKCEKEDESPCSECAMNYTSKWERRPKKTRQDEFLKLFPRTRTDMKGFIDLAPCDVDVDILEMDARGRCKRVNAFEDYCDGCRKAYWNEEVEE